MTETTLTARFMQTIRQYADTGEVVVDPKMPPTSITPWLTSFLDDTWWTRWLRHSVVCRKIFYLTLSRHIADLVHARQFQMQRQTTVRHKAHAIIQLADGYKTNRQYVTDMINALGDELEPDGFDTRFFHRLYAASDALDPMFWQKLSHDWLVALDHHVDTIVSVKADRDTGAIRKRLEFFLTRADDYLTQKDADSQHEIAKWNAMDGEWTVSAWEDANETIEYGNRFPQLVELVDKMGRTQSQDGNRRFTTTVGRQQRLRRMGGSDIEGIGIGSELSSLLPSEWAQCLDESMEDLFWYKYSRQSLQTFRHVSNTANPSRQFSTDHAAQKGPMIVCFDTSASMAHSPHKLSKTLLALIEEKAELEGRDCYLIDFSVDIKTIDLRQRRADSDARLIGLHATEHAFGRDQLPFIGQGTNAKGMITQVFAMLNDHHRPFVNADVLIVSDFVMPLPDCEQCRQMEWMRQTGTRFFGLQLVEQARYRIETGKSGALRYVALNDKDGNTEPQEWTHLLKDGMAQVEYRTSRMQ